MGFLSPGAYSDLFQANGDCASLTKIVCTLGPSSNDFETLEKLLRCGMRGARLDLTWATPEWCKQSIINIQEAELATNTLAAVMLDTCGPEISVVHKRERREVSYASGSIVKLVRGKDNVGLSADTVPVACQLPFTQLDVPHHAAVFVNNYLAAGSESNTLSLVVEEVQPDVMMCRVQADAVLDASFKLALHGRSIHNHLPILSESDKAKILKLSECSIHFLLLSYCRNASDVAQARKFLDESGMSAVKIIAKLATPQALERRREIIEAAAAIVVSRGTLGLELAPEKVFIAQKLCLADANLAGKPAIVTRVVDSMVHAPRPTRAEATDVANLVLDGADCILLGLETFKGSNPVLVVKTVRSICHQAEQCYDSQAFYNTMMEREGGYRGAIMNKTEALASSAVRATSKLGATLVLAFTKTGRTPRLIAKWRTNVPILTVVAKGEEGNDGASRVARQSAVLRGVIPLLALPSCVGQMAVDGTMTDWALRMAERMNLVRKGERVVVSQCPRVLPDGLFEEAAVVKFVVAGDVQAQPLHYSSSWEALADIAVQ